MIEICGTEGCENKGVHTLHLEKGQGKIILCNECIRPVPIYVLNEEGEKIFIPIIT